MHRPDLDLFRAVVAKEPNALLRDQALQVLDYVMHLEGALRPLARIVLPVPVDQWSAPHRAITATVEEARRLFPQG